MRNQAHATKSTAKRFAYRGPQNNNNSESEEGDQISPRKSEESHLYGQKSELDSTWSIRKNVSVGLTGSSHGLNQDPPTTTSFYSRYNLRSNASKADSADALQEGSLRLGGSCGYSWGNKSDHTNAQLSSGPKSFSSQTDYSLPSLKANQHATLKNTNNISPRGSSLYSPGGQLSGVKANPSSQAANSSATSNRSNKSWDDFY